MSAISSVNLNLLVSLVRLHETRSVSRAARSLGLTQPAMSYNLKRLREIFDDVLFVRDGRSLVPTPLEEELVVKIRRGLGELERALDSPKAFDPAQSTRRFTIVGNDYFEAVALPRIMERLGDEAPGICLELVPYNRHSRREFEAGEFELLAGSDEMLAEAQSRTAVMYRDPLVCIEADRGPAEPLDLERYLSRSHILVHVDRSDGAADMMLREQGRRRRFRARVSSFACVPRLVLAGDAIATVPLGVVARAPMREQLRVHRPPLSLPPITARLFWHERFDGDAGTRWLMGVLRELADELAEEIGQVHETLD